MARQIDDSKPLSDVDRAWLISRNRQDEVARIDAMHSGEAPEAPEPIPAPPAVGSEVARLGDYLAENFPQEIGEGNLQNGEGAVDVAIRLLDRTLDAGEDEPGDEGDEPETHTGEGSTGSEGSSDAPAPQEPIVDGTTAQDGGSDANPAQVAETPEQRPAQLSEARTADTYDDWTNDELKEELGKRELSKSGVKSELVARLREDDAA